MALEGEESVVAAHAVTVVDDADELAAAGFDLDTNAGSAGVEGVFEEFFDYRCGAFDDFAGSDLIGDLIGKYMNPAHCSIVVSLAGKSLTQRAQWFRGGRGEGERPWSDGTRREMAGCRGIRCGWGGFCRVWT